MKQFLFFLFISTSVFAQDFSSIKTKTDTYSGLLTAEKLANNIKRDFSTNEDKVKAVFCWITKNIRYDLEEYYSLNRKVRFNFRYRNQEEFDTKMQEIKDNIVSKTLSNRKAICEGYAQTFAKVCDLLNIENEIVKGYVRQSSNNIGKPEQLSNHSWNAVKLNNQWIFIDTTWAAGTELNGRWIRLFNSYYYNISKETFFKTHYPEKSIWKLQVGRMEKKEFYRQPIYQPSFLVNGYKLAEPTSGILARNSDGKIEIRLKNVTSSQKIHIGFLGNPYAQNPTVTNQNGITTVSILVPNNVKQLFLMIDKQTVLQFLVK